jgi:hypothetical protein
MQASIRRSIIIGLLLAVPYVRASGQAARISGTVTDSVHRAPLVDATVLATPVAPTRDTVFHSARTDASGRFQLAGLQAGTYEISVEHPFTDSIGLAVPSREVQATPNGSPPLALALPSVGTLRRTLCRAAVSDTTLGVMLGVVRRADGSTVRGANVVFEWTDVSVDKATLRARQTRMSAATTTDSVGVYRACGVPAGIALFVQAQLGAGEQSGVVEEHIGEAGVLVRELVLGDSARSRQLATGAEAGADTGAVHGDGVVRGVVRGERDRPIADAQVHLFGTSRVARTNAQGEFRLADIPTGTQGLEVIALGYAPRRFRAEISATTEPMTVTMSKFAAMLDSIRVTARRVASGRRYSEFDERERSRRLVGQFFTEEDIEKKHPFLTSDLLRQIRGFAVAVGPDGKVMVGQNRGVYTLRGMLPGGNSSGGGGRACPTIFVDGVESALELNEIPPSWIHGIEVYQQGEAPAKYSTFCGAILIWTK